MYEEHEVYVGKDLGGQEIEITADLIENYIRATGDASALYREGASPVAPALILFNEVYNHGGWYLPNIFGNLHARQEWDIYRPIPRGDRVRTRCTVIDRYLKRDREYIVNEALAFDGSGRLACRGRTHQSFLMEAVPDALSAEARKKEKKERPPHPSTLEGKRLEPVARKITLDMSRAFSGPSENYHTDEAMAQQLGFPKVIVQGMLSTCLVSDLMTREFGEGWLRGGRMAVNLTGIVWADDTVTTHGTIRSVAPEGSHRRVTLAVWGEKDDGTLTLAGEASALADER